MMNKTGNNIFFSAFIRNLNQKNIFGNFNEKVRKSIPFYEETQLITLDIIQSFLEKHSMFFEMGCLTGYFKKHMHEALNLKRIKSIGIDISENMINNAKKIYSEFIFGNFEGFLAIK